LSYSCNNKLKEKNEYEALAFKYYENEEYTSSLKAAGDYLFLDTTNPEIYIIKGISECHLNDFINSKISLQNALDIDPKSVSAHFNKGYLHYMKNETDSALKEFDYSLQLKTAGDIIIEFDNEQIKKVQTQLGEIYFFRGIIFHETDNDSLALENFSKANDNYYNLKQTKLYLGLTYLNLGDTEKGCKFLKDSKKEGNVEAAQYISERCGNVQL